MPEGFPYCLAIWPLDAIGPWEWAIIAVFGLLLFGGRLPELGRRIGRGLAELRKGVGTMQEEIARGAQEAETPPDADGTKKPEA